MNADARPIIMLIIYLVLFILQIYFLVKSIKRDSARYKVATVFLEICFLILAVVVAEYFDKLPGYGFMPGFSYLGEILFSAGAACLYFVLFYVTCCIYIVIYERCMNRKRKIAVHPMLAILAFSCVIVGIGFAMAEIYDHWNKREVSAIVVELEEVRTGGGLEHWPILSFTVAGEEYKSSYPMGNAAIGDVVDVYYYPWNDGYRVTTYRENFKWVYIPAFGAGIGLLLVRYVKHRDTGKDTGYTSSVQEIEKEHGEF